MIKEGDWVDAYGGYGIVVRIFHEYYERWWNDIPENKIPGDKRQDVVIIKRFCSHQFKVYPQTKVMSIKLVSEIEKSDLDKITTLLKDEKNLRRFERYQTDDSISDVTNWDQHLSETKFEEIKDGLKGLENNTNLKMTMMEISALLKQEFDIDLFARVDKIPRPNCYIQMISCGLGVYRNKEKLFKEIRIHKKCY